MAKRTTDGEPGATTAKTDDRPYVLEVGAVDEVTSRKKLGAKLATGWPNDKRNIDFIEQKFDVQGARSWQVYMQQG